MKLIKFKKAIGLKGIFKNQKIEIEGTLSEVFGRGVVLPELAVRGNFAAINAIDRENYTVDDEPFFYGKMGALGYIISQKDFKFLK